MPNKINRLGKAFMEMLLADSHVRFCGVLRNKLIASTDSLAWHSGLSGVSHG